MASTLCWERAQSKLEHTSNILSSLPVWHKCCQSNEPCPEEIADGSPRRPGAGRAPKKCMNYFRVQVAATVKKVFFFFFIRWVRMTVTDDMRYEKGKRTGRREKLMVVQEGLEQGRMNTNIQFPGIRWPSAERTNDRCRGTKLRKMGSASRSHRSTAKVFWKEKMKMGQKKGSCGHLCLRRQPKWGCCWEEMVTRGEIARKDWNGIKKCQTKRTNDNSVSLKKAVSFVSW